MSHTDDVFSLDVDYEGRAGALFALSFKTLLLTFLTLGIYRFWMRARMRRYYWSAIQPGGVPLEYTGTGLEKFLGFLIAAVFLAIYLGIANLALSFFGIAVFEGNALALNLSLIAVIPLIFYARYRARRYILSRTLWRGLRFGAEPAAFGYMLHALWHSFLTVITLGILLPRQTFHLEKYVTDRTWYGDLKWRQNGRWTMLLRPWIWVIFALILLVGTIVAAGAFDDPSFLIGTVAAAFLLIIAAVRYAVVSFRLLTAHKAVGATIEFASSVRTGKVIRIYLLGALATFLASLVVLFALGALGALLGIAAMNWDFSFEGAAEQFEAAGMSAAAIAYVIFGYVLFFLVLGALAQVVFVQPMLRHYAATLLIKNAHEIETAGQRPEDQNVEAGGFADALDVGAAM